MASFDQTLQLLAWLVALIELILGFYVLFLNPRNATNRYVSFFLLILSINTFALGSFTGAVNVRQAILPSILVAATSPMIVPGLLLAAIAMLKPDLLTGRWSWIRWVLYVMLALPPLLTLIDVLTGANLWYTALNPAAYNGGYATLDVYTGGLLGGILLTISFSLVGILATIFFLYFALLDKSASRLTKRIAWWLLVANLFPFIFTTLILRAPQFSISSVLITSALYAMACSYAIFQQLISEQRWQPGSLQSRLTGMILIVTLPLVIAVAVFLTNRARQQFEIDAIHALEAANHTLADTTTLWLGLNVKALQNLIQSPDIISMDPAKQKPVLESMTSAYPHMYLVSTTENTGLNVARSDDADPKDYSDRVWVQGALSGAPLTYQTLIGRTSGQPALVASMPIRDQQDEIIGVGMFASNLEEISHLVSHSEIGQGGYTFVVDAHNLLVAHPDPEQTAELKDMSVYLPVIALREGVDGAYDFTDENGERWRAVVSRLPNGWGVVAQQPEAALLAPIRTFQRLAIFVALLGAILLITLAWTTVRQGIRPIRALTDTALAIAAGDLERSAPVESQDEIGMLAHSFNTMTGQMRELISDLEGRVTERTQDLERRALQLQVTAEVAREASAIRDMDQLLDNVVSLISERFNFYHAGIFLLQGSGASDSRSYAVLRAASSEGGQRMLERQHRLRVGQVGIVGYVAAAGLPRIALDVGVDAVFFNNPDLPQTRSEMALPLKIQDKVIGVLDVQSTEPSAFTEEDLETLQILADLVALAIEDTRLLTESQQAVRELETRYGMQLRQGWAKKLREGSLAYAFDHTGVKPVRGTRQADLDLWFSGAQAVQEHTNEDDNLTTIQVPIELRGLRLGFLRLRRDKDQGEWSQGESELIRESISQLALSLENARLLEEIQSRARQEELINQIVSRTQSSLNLDAVMRTAVQEVGRIMNFSKAQIRLTEPLSAPTPASPSANQRINDHSTGQSSGGSKG